MGVWRKVPQIRRWGGLWLALAAVFPLLVAAQSRRPDAPKPHVEPHQLSGDFPHKPSLAPAWSIPVDSVGFAAPGELYLGQRNSLASLDFLDENHLLFTFRVPALLHRQPGEKENYQRQIRAVVLSLPSGRVEAEANWLLHDRSRYLWMLHDGHFLLRDRDSLQEGDASLTLKPYLRFPGTLLTVHLDPNQQFLVTSSREPAKTTPQDQASAAPNGGSDGEEDAGQNAPDLVLRILHRKSGAVMMASRMRELVHVPVNSEGYLENLRGSGVDWTVQMNDFGGGNHLLGTVKSACMPQESFLTDRELLATACADTGSNALVAMTTGGDKLWIDLVPDRQVWPVLTVAPHGQRVARETLYVSHAVSAFAPLSNEDIKGQWLQVLDSATGQVAFESPVTPILDAGGNVALSPSSRRVAVLNGTAIQVFELPPAPVP